MNIAVVGAQWGDEGKGKVVDLLAPRFSIVARYQGGHNAGHTVHVGGKRFVLRLIPSGILNPGVACVIGNGLVVDLKALFDEVEELRQAAISVDGRLFVSDRAHVILPFHRDLDKLNEASLGSRKIGTTSRGIGPAYEAKVARRGLRTCDLADAEFVEEHIRQGLDTLNLMNEDAHYDWRELVASTLALGERLQPMLTDVSVLLADAMKAGQSILFEGAQGTMLDVDHGTYPYVTSSSSTAGGACTGLGIGPGTIGAVIGIAKAYTTRVGEGPFPSELHDDSGAALREKGQEFGAVTGRPRRCGWFDAVVVRHAVRVNGLGGLALTKLDVLDGLDKVEICVGYRIDDTAVTEFPADLRRVQRAVPVLETMPGWKTPTAGVRDFAALPAEAKAYVARLEALTGVRVLLVSTGAAREDTLITDDPRAIEWFGTRPASQG
ncbi:MAG: adenylosuccinate synthase [Acidobacteria bacterium]|jgi:adenylosuccinate synthase|nr:adenylosuccinate synthase [Acidobacteriota bacterium]